MTAVIAFCVSWHYSPGGRMATADSPVRVLRVEEDWELVVHSSDPNSAAPQISCVFSPTNNLDSVYGCVELNHRSQPSFQGGGVQVQAWDGDVAMAFDDAEDVSVMSTAHETIRWTQAMTLVDGQIVFEVINGSSHTWGSFGDSNRLATALPTELSNLNGYSPSLSIANSGVGYASNRVRSLVLKRVRCITATGDVLEDDTERDADFD